MQRILLILGIGISFAVVVSLQSTTASAACYRIIGGIHYPCTYTGQSVSSQFPSFFQRSASSRSSLASKGYPWMNRSSSVSRLYQRAPRGSGCQNKHLVSQLIPSEYLDCSGVGWVFPGLIWGDCPMTMCMIKTKPGVFGGLTF